jgi:hypothetical protein
VPKDRLSLRRLNCRTTHLHVTYDGVKGFCCVCRVRLPGLKCWRVEGFNHFCCWVHLWVILGGPYAMIVRRVFGDKSPQRAATTVQPSL